MKMLNLNSKCIFQTHIPQETSKSMLQPKFITLLSTLKPVNSISRQIFEPNKYGLSEQLCEQKDENKIANVLTFMKSIFNESKYLEKQTSFNQEAGLKYYFKNNKSYAVDSLRILIISK